MDANGTAGTVGPAYAALDMPVPDTYAVEVRGETHQIDLVGLDFSKKRTRM